MTLFRHLSRATRWIMKTMARPRFSLGCDIKHQESFLNCGNPLRKEAEFREFRLNIPQDTPCHCHSLSLSGSLALGRVWHSCVTTAGMLVRAINEQMRLW